MFHKALRGVIARLARTGVFTLLAAIALAVAVELRAVDISGTVVDADGRALGGAHVSLDSAEPKTGIIPICRSCYPDCREASDELTDAVGHFATVSDGR